MKDYIFSLKLGSLGGVFLFFLFFVTSFFVQPDGINIQEGALLFFLGVFFYFWIVVILGTWGLNNYIKNNTDGEVSFLKRFLLIILFSIVSYLLYLVLDSLYFLVDDSLTKDFVRFLEKNDQNTDYKGFGFYELPFSYINVTTPLGFLGVFITMLLVKKDGQLIKNKEKEF